MTTFIQTRTWKVWFAVLSFTMIVSHGFAASEVPPAAELWTAKFTKDVNWQQLTDAGYLVVCTDDGVYGYDPVTGKEAWKMEDVKKIPEDYFSPISGTQFAAITQSAGALGAMTMTLIVDVTTGKTMWTTKELEIMNASGYFLVMEDMALWLYGQKAKGGKYAIFYIDLESGKVLWSSEELAKKAPTMHKLRPESNWSTRMGIQGNQPPLYVDGTIIEYMSPAGLRRVSAKDGSILWKSKMKSKKPPSLVSGYSPMLLSKDKKIVYVPHEEFLDAVNVETGEVLWKKPAKFRSSVVQMSETENGLVLRGSRPKPFINVINSTTGEKQWKKPFKDLEGASSFAVKGDKLYISADESLFEIDIASGTNKEIVKKVKFSGGEIANSLELTDKGILLISSQNMQLYEYSGNRIFAAYHKAPGSSLLAKVASTAAIMAVNAASAANAYGQAQATGMSQKYSLITSNPTMSKRFKATEMGQGFVTVLTDVNVGTDKGKGIVKVSKADGKDVKGVVLDTKEPKYEFDDVERRLFFLKDDKTIICYSF